MPYSMQIGKEAEREDLGSVFLETLIADSLIVPKMFDGMKGVFHSCTDG